MHSSGVQIALDDLPIWKKYNFRCVVHPMKWAVCLHESPPKSLNPNWKNEPENRFPLCNECHMQIHELPLSKSYEYLREQRSKNYPNYVV